MASSRLGLLFELFADSLTGRYKPGVPPPCLSIGWESVEDPSLVRLMEREHLLQGNLDGTMVTNSASPSGSRPGAGFPFEPLQFLLCVSMLGFSVGKEATVGQWLMLQELLGSFLG